MSKLKKLIAPLIVTSITLFIVLVYAVSILSVFQSDIGPAPIVLLLILAAILAGIAFVLVKNLIERIHEVKEEEKDDISKY